MHKTWYLDPTRVRLVWTSPRQDLDSQRCRDPWITFRLTSKLNARLLTQGPVTLSTPQPSPTVGAALASRTGTQNTRRTLLPAEKEPAVCLGERARNDHPSHQERFAVSVDMNC